MNAKGAFFKPAESVDQPYGAYTPHVEDNVNIFWAISCFGVLGSILVFRRLVLPIPDQIAGASVAKDLESSEKKRNSSKDYTPLVERLHSIVQHNRIELNDQYIILRVLEYLVSHRRG